MLRFRNVNIALFVIFWIMNGLNFFHPFHPGFYVIPFGLHLATIFYGSFFIGSNFYMDVICSVKTMKREIALTFDDGPMAEITSEILDILKEFDVKATFFCIGRRIPGNENILQRMLDEGHLIGNHTESHSYFFDVYTQKMMINDIKEVEDQIKKIVKKKPLFFRPPYGVTNPTIKKVLKHLNYKPIGWSIRSLDTHTWKSETQISDRVIRRIKPGRIVLFHDINPKIPAILRKVLEHAKSANYSIVPLDKLLNLPAYE